MDPPHGTGGFRKTAIGRARILRTAGCPQNDIKVICHETEKTDDCGETKEIDDSSRDCHPEQLQLRMDPPRGTGGFSMCYKEK